MHPNNSGAKPVFSQQRVAELVEHEITNFQRIEVTDPRFYVLHLRGCICGGLQSDKVIWHYTSSLFISCCSLVSEMK